MTLTPVRCCCHPENLIGYLPADTEGYKLRELDDGTKAFDSNHDEEGVRNHPDFVPFDGEQAGKKTWRKTWRK